MKNISHLLFVAILIFGSFPNQGFASRQKVEDCSICGHVCCCPEICASKIKEVKKKEAPSHCSVEHSEHSDAKGCNQPVSICRITSKEPFAALLLEEKTVLINPRAGILGSVRPDNRDNSQSFLEAKSFLLFPCFHETPTPPPRLNA